MPLNGIRRRLRKGPAMSSSRTLKEMEGVFKRKAVGRSSANWWTQLFERCSGRLARSRKSGEGEKTIRWEKMMCTSAPPDEGPDPRLPIGVGIMGAALLFQDHLVQVHLICCLDPSVARHSPSPPQSTPMTPTIWSPRIRFIFDPSIRWKHKQG
jgi:hypothetical protein